MNRFGLKRIIIVGDRGMLTSARIREELKPVEGIDWITALKTPQIRKMMAKMIILRLTHDESFITVTIRTFEIAAPHLQ